MIGNGLRLFVSDKDLRWSGLGGAGDVGFTVESLINAVRVSLRLFNVMPSMQDEADTPRIEVQRDPSQRGFQITVIAPFMTSGFATPLQLAIEARITHVDGKEFSGEFVTVPKEPEPAKEPEPPVASTPKVSADVGVFNWPLDGWRATFLFALHMFKGHSYRWSELSACGNRWRVCRCGWRHEVFGP